jgi:hypothetical protein
MKGKVQGRLQSSLKDLRWLNTLGSCKAGERGSGRAGACMEWQSSYRLSVPLSCPILPLSLLASLCERYLVVKA